MAKQAQTVLGLVNVDKLGFMLVREVMKMGMLGWHLDPLLKFDRAGALERAVAKVNKGKERGITAILDSCTIETRDAAFIQEVAKRTGVHIICATGLFAEARDPLKKRTFSGGFPSYFHHFSSERIQEIYEHELTHGIGPERVRPGFVKACISEGGISANEEKAMRAAARAAKRHDVPIFTVTIGMLGAEQLAMLTEEGLPAHRIMIGGCDRSQDVAYSRRIGELGAYIGFDCIGLSELCPEEIRVRNLVQLVKDGFARQIMLSLESIASYHVSDRDMTDDQRNRLNAPTRQYTYLTDDFIPRLRREGVKESDIHLMTVENPRRIFAGEKL